MRFKTQVAGWTLSQDVFNIFSCSDVITIHNPPIPPITGFVIELLPFHLL